MNKTNTQHSSRNEAIKAAYFDMLKVATQLLSTIEQEDFRHTLVREKEPVKAYGLIHEFVNPLLFLRLSLLEDGIYAIHYGFEPCVTYAHITMPFCRSVYKLSMKDCTAVNIENSIKTDWFIHNPDEMYEYIAEQNKYHTYKQIKYKPTASQRKQMHAVA